MEMGNVSKIQQPDHRTDNKSSMQREIPALGGVHTFFFIYHFFLNLIGFFFAK